MFRIGELDEVLHAAAGNAGEFDYYAAGHTVPQSHYTGEGNYVQLNRLLGLYAKGGTLHVSNIQKYFQPLRRFCAQAQREFLVDCEADLWLTRENAFTPYLHFDRYDIFVLQIHGRKRWRLFEPLPIADKRITAALDWSEVGEPIIDVLVEPGDLIYIPPHAPHVVTTCDPHSVHIGIGLHPLTWRQILDISLDECREKPNALSETVPLDFVRSLAQAPEAALDAVRQRVGRALGDIDANAVRDGIYAHFLLDVKHPDDEHVLSQILRGTPIEAETLLVRRDGSLARAYLAADGRAVLCYGGGGNISGPAAYLPALRFLAETHAPFTALDIDPSLDLSARVSLLQRAVDAGFCHRQ
jgi:hypothetical protein